MTTSIVPYELRRQIRELPDFRDRLSLCVLPYELNDVVEWYAREIMEWDWHCRYCGGKNYRRNSMGHLECRGCGAPTDA